MNKENWQEHVEAWKTSGQTQREYCDNHDLNFHTFKYWRQNLR